ncbi:MAG: BrnT family toxin [Acidobacteriaceae bacterium]
MDEAKAASNRRKHGLNFESGMLVFSDSSAISEPDRIVDGELRWQVVGMFEDRALLTVACTINQEGLDEVVRIISVRRATRRERIAYEQNRQENN